MASGLAEKHEADIDDAFFARVAEVTAQLIAGEISTGVDPVSGDLMMEDMGDDMMDDQAARNDDGVERFAWSRTWDVSMTAPSISRLMTARRQPLMSMIWSTSSSRHKPRPITKAIFRPASTKALR